MYQIVICFDAFALIHHTILLHDAQSNVLNYIKDNDRAETSMPSNLHKITLQILLMLHDPRIALYRRRKQLRVPNLGAKNTFLRRPSLFHIKKTHLHRIFRNVPRNTLRRSRWAHTLIFFTRPESYCRDYFLLSIVFRAVAKHRKRSIGNPIATKQTAVLEFKQ